MQYKALSVLAGVVVCTLALPVPSEDKVLLHRVVRQFDPSQFLKPSFSMAGGMFPFSLGQQQAQSRDSSSSSSSSSSSNSSNSNNRSNEGEQAENGEGRQPESGQGRQPESGQLQSSQGRQPQGGQGGQLPGPGSMFGGQMSRSSSSRQYNLFDPAQFFMPSQNQNPFNTFSSSSSSAGSSPYFAVGVAPFSNLISPSQFVNPRDRVDSQPQASVSSGSELDFTGNAAGGADPSGPVGMTGDSGNGQIFQPPGFFINPGTSV